MKSKINNNIENNAYKEKLNSKHVIAYEAHAGWIDYLVSEKIIFSHRNSLFSQVKHQYLHINNYFELVIYRQGTMEYIAENQTLIAEPNVIILSKPLTFHMNRPFNKDTCERYVLYFMENIKYETMFNECVFDILSATNQSSLYIKLSDEKAQELYNRLDTIEETLQADFKYSDALAMTYLIQLFIFLSQNSNQTEYSSSPPNAPTEKIYQIKEYIDNEYANIHNISELAQRFYYSREYITREFKRYFNTPIYQYILNRKLLLSKKYIHLGMTIDKAARMAGFTNMASFIKFFKKDTGLTPSEYQKNYIDK